MFKSMEEKVKLSFKDYLKVTKTNLNDKLGKQASVIYDVGVKLEHLEDALRRLDHELDLKESKIYRDMSHKYSSLKNITSTRINAEVTCHHEVIELKNKKL